MKFNWKIKSIEIQGFKAFDEKIKLNFAQDITAIIGTNASGKTSLLRAISIAFDYLILTLKAQKRDLYKISRQFINQNSQEHFISLFLDFEINKQVEKYNGSLKLTLNFDHFGNVISDITLVSINPEPKDLEISELGTEIFENSLPQEIIGGKYKTLPIFVFYATDDWRLEPLKDKESWFLEPLNFWFHCCNKETMNFFYPTTWLLKIITRIKSNLATEKEKAFKEKLDQAITQILKNGTEWEIDLDFDEIDTEIYLGFKKNDILLKFSQLASGEKSLIALVIDLARRLFLANPEAENPLAGNGIVLIDELDLHLHPKWQREVLPTLHRIFPNIQFIVTTHSAFILSEINNLIRAKLIADKYPEKKQQIQDLVSEDKWVDFDKVEALLLKENNAVSLKDTENKIILAKSIDDVSEQIIDTYDELLNLEL